MIIDKKNSLRPILESSDGIHLTAYLVNRHDVEDLKNQIRSAISEAYECLQPVMSIQDRKAFLEPLDSLVGEVNILKNLKENVGLFRTKDAFRILSLPVEVESRTFVATSFHVKPVLKWMQMDKDFLVLGVSSQQVYLYLGNQTSFQKIDKIAIPKEYLKDLKQNQTSKQDYSWLNDWISEITQNAKLQLFVAGQPELTKNLIKHINYKFIRNLNGHIPFSEKKVKETYDKVRVLAKVYAKKLIEKSLIEFQLAEMKQQAKKNIFQISKAAVNGKVRKLIVADEVNIFGKIDKKTGGLEINPIDLDYEDDDILDDLAQTVLAHGGEVVVVSKSEIPKERPILALVDTEEVINDKNHYIEMKNMEV